MIQFCFNTSTIEEMQRVLTPLLSAGIKVAAARSRIRKTQPERTVLFLRLASKSDLQQRPNIRQSQHLIRFNLDLGRSTKVDFSTRKASDDNVVPLDSKSKGYLKVTKRLDTLIDSHITQINQVITDSSNLELQRVKIHPLIQNPLPLANQGYAWRPYYFDDIKESRLYTELKELVEKNNIRTDQEAFLINIAQMSGSGKTHLALTYSRIDGGIPISFSSPFYFDLIRTASKFIHSLYPSPDALARFEVLSIDAEDLYLKQAIRVMQLIPLTFLQFAGVFLQKESVKAKREALVRALMNGCKSVIAEMYGTNLKKYAKDEKKFKDFYDAMLQVAKHFQISAIFYDEVHRLSAECKGQFIHASTAIDAPIRLERLRRERSEYNVPADTTFKKTTSLLYVLNLAMEEFARDKLAQITSTTVYSATLFYEAEDYSRERLAIKLFLHKENSIDRQERFQKVFCKAFGNQMEPLLKLPENAAILKRLSSRANYLFNPLTDIKSSATLASATTLEEFAKKYFEMAEKEAKNSAQKYFDKAASQPLSKYMLQKFMVDVYLGANSVELEASDLEACVRNGLVQLPDSENKQKFETAVDYYLREIIRARPLQSLLQSFVSVQKHWNAGTIGEYLATSMIQYCAEKNAPVSTLMTKPYVISDTKASNITLGPARIAHRLSDFKPERKITDDSDFLELNSLNEELNTLLIPSQSFGPDGILPLAPDARHEGFLVYQCKHHQDPITWKFFLESTFASVQPLAFYTGASDKFAKWVNIFTKIKAATNLWIRVIYARGFASEVWDKVHAYNTTLAGQAHPIILITPKTLFPQFSDNDRLCAVNQPPAAITKYDLSDDELEVLRLQTPDDDLKASIDKQKKYAELRISICDDRKRAPKK